MEKLRRILRCQKGANAIEYALVAGLISIAAVAAMGSLGDRITMMYVNISANMK